MKYYFYRTTNLINGKYYQGVHHSRCPEKDPYCGSGLGIINAVKKYGRENFKVEIIKYFDSLDEAYKYEAEIITPESLDARICYNQVPGGRGCKEGVIHMSKGDEEIRVHKILQKVYEEMGYVKGRSAKTRENVSKVRKGKPSKQKGRIYLHKGFDKEIRVKPEEVETYLKQGYEKGHSGLAKQRVREKHQGRLWINNGSEEKCILPVELESYLNKGYVKGTLPKTEEHKKAISRAMKGKVQSQETRERKRMAKQGRTWKLIDGRRVWSERKDM